jgi:hypothetical protein
MQSTGRCSFTTLRKVWLLQRRFQWNACLRDNCLYRTPTPNFMKTQRTVQPPMLGRDRLTWSPHKVFCSLCLRNKAWALTPPPALPPPSQAEIHEPLSLLRSVSQTCLSDSIRTRFPLSLHRSPLRRYHRHPLPSNSADIPRPVIIHRHPLCDKHTQTPLVHLSNATFPTLHVDICGNLRHKVLNISCTLTSTLQTCSSFNNVPNKFCRNWVTVIRTAVWFHGRVLDTWNVQRVQWRVLKLVSLSLFNCEDWVFLMWRCISVSTRFEGKQCLHRQGMRRPAQPLKIKALRSFETLGHKTQRHGVTCQKTWILATSLWALQSRTAVSNISSSPLHAVGQEPRRGACSGRRWRGRSGG